MSKRRTKEQKIIANLRRELQLKSQSNKDQFRLAPKQKTKTFQQEKETLDRSFSYSPKIVSNASPVNYNYLKNDLLKTGILTGLITAFELILFFLSKNHIIPLAL